MTQDSELAWTCVQDPRLSLNPHSLVVRIASYLIDCSHIRFLRRRWRIFLLIMLMGYLIIHLLSLAMFSAGLSISLPSTS